MKYLSTLDRKYAIIDKKFRKESGSYNLAKSIVRQGIDSTTDSEKEEIGKEFGISASTVSGVFTKLRSLGLLGNTLPISPIITSRETNNQVLPPNQELVASHTPPTNLDPPSNQEYATRADLERLETAIVGLTTMLVDDEGEEYTDEEPEQAIQEPTQVPPNITGQSHTILDESSMKQMGTWIFAKNLLYFDFARQGTFGGALENFDGNWSDFVNIVIEAYFERTSNVGIGLLRKRFA